MKINQDRLAAKLSDISSALKRLKNLGQMSKNEFLSDEDSQDIARSRLITATEAALNICFHITAKELNQVPKDYSDCFNLLGKNGIIPDDLAKSLSQMANFRNRIVHLYWDIDYGQIYDLIINYLKDLEYFSKHIAEQFLE